MSDQVEPQPVTQAFRPAGEPLPGATIVTFETLGDGLYRLEYILNDAPMSVEYEVFDTSVTFVFTDGDGTSSTETYERLSPEAAKILQ